MSSVGKYVVLDLTDIGHGEPIKMIATVDDLGLARIEATEDHEISRPDSESGIVWLEETGNIIAVPTEPDLPDYADLWEKMSR